MQLDFEYHRKRGSIDLKQVKHKSLRGFVCRFTIVSLSCKIIINVGKE